MINWLIAVPAWGVRAVYLFRNYMVPAILECADHVDGNIRFIVHTDLPGLIEDRLSGLDCMTRPVAFTHNRYTAMSIAHRDAIEMARPGEAVLLATADMVLSVEALAACEKQFARGKKTIACLGMRTIEGNLPPIGVHGYTLIEWGWEHKHPWIEHSILGTGGTVITSHLYFLSPAGVAMHGFHLHPLALLREARELKFKGTIDYDLLECFPHDEIHVVTDPREFAVIELTPIWQADFGTRKQPNTVNDIVAWASQNTSATHRWMFGHHIKILGDTMPDPAVNEILARIERLAA